MGKDELTRVLADMLTSVQRDDSFEGSIEYLTPTPEDPPCDFMVRASYRIGNSMGQGGVRMIGDTS